MQAIPREAKVWKREKLLDLATFQVSTTYYELSLVFFTGRGGGSVQNNGNILQLCKGQIQKIFSQIA